MTTETNPKSPAPSEATASRRDFVAGAVTMAAAGGAATGAQAQTPSNLRFSNPAGMSSPPGYSHVIEVTGPHRVVYFAVRPVLMRTARSARIFARRRCRCSRTSRSRWLRSAAASSTSSR